MSQSDKELLELAAKAYGLVEHHYAGDQVGMRELAVHGVPHCGYADGPAFNPLNDDGDALRLAVKLGLRVYIYPGGGDDYTLACSDELSRIKVGIREEHGSDAFAATRRAIVRAAAEIGRAMP